MESKYPENQRVREVMATMGYKDRPHPFAIEVLKLDRSDKIQNIYNDRNRISTELLVMITTKVVKDNQFVNGHWILTGEGSMFLDDKKTAPEKEAVELQELFKDLAHLREVNGKNVEIILNLSRAVSMVNQG
jgi:hypothetical protein